MKAFLTSKTQGTLKCSRNFASENLFVDHGNLQQGNCGMFFFQIGLEQVDLIRGNGALIVMDGNMRGGCWTESILQKIFWC